MEKYNGGNNTSPQLFSNPPQCKNMIPQEQNDTTHTHQWILSLHLPKHAAKLEDTFSYQEKLNPSNCK